MKVMSGQQKSISVMLNTAGQNLIANNRKKLRSIVETIILCGRQNIPLRGHRDSSVDLESTESQTVSHGNFWALLQFQISAGDVVLKDHLACAPKNATYTSANIQNQIIQVRGDHVREKILHRVRKAKCFTLIADEVTDCAKKEQLCIVLRYVDEGNFSINEDLVTFLECDSGISGQVLAEMMLEFLRKQCVDPTKLRGQAYDGAGNMSGKKWSCSSYLISVSTCSLHPLRFPLFEPCCS